MMDGYKWKEFLIQYILIRGFPGGSVVKNSPAMQEMPVWSLGREDPLEKETATRSNIVAWRRPWTKEPGGLQSIRGLGGGQFSFGQDHPLSCWHLK